MKTIVITGCIGLLLAGCAPKKVLIGTTAPATAASGYATPTSSRLDPNETLTTAAKLQVYNTSNGLTDQTEITVRTSATGNFDDFILTHNAQQVAMTWDFVNNWYSGSAGNMDYKIFPQWESPDKQLTMAWTNMDDTSGSGTSYYGGVVAGFNSSPADVAGRTGTATYNGFGQVYVSAQDNSFYAHAEGGATLTADFGAGLISGSMLVSDSGHSYGGVIVPSTTVTINPSAISNNTFGSTATLNPNDFGMASIGGVGVDGMFYGSGATGVGGYLTGVGTALNGLTPVYLNGAFVGAN